jgi:hypothetical protein
LKCAEWVLEIQDMTDEQQPFTLATLVSTVTQTKNF